MAIKTRFMDSLGDHDGDNPANWTAGLPQLGYDARIGPVSACNFSQGYECLSLMVENNVTTVTFNGGSWIFTDAMRLEYGTILVTDITTIDGSLSLSPLAGSDCSKLSVYFTQPCDLEINAAGIPIGDVVFRSTSDFYCARFFGLDCELLDVDGEVQFGSYAQITVRGSLIIRPGAKIYASITNPMLNIQGNISAEPGTYTWVAGTGGCHFTAAGDQTVDLGGMEGTFDPVIITKPAGQLILQGDLTCVSLDHQSGTLDPGGKSITTTGNCRIAPGAKLADLLDGSAWTVGGDLDWQGEDGDRLVLHGTSPWLLSALGEVTVRYTEVAFCDARGGNAINVLDGTSINGGNNLNWLFLPKQPFSVAAGCVQSSGALAGVPVVPAAVAGETFVASTEAGIPVVPTAVAGETFIAAAEKGVVHA